MSGPYRSGHGRRPRRRLNWAAVPGISLAALAVVAWHVWLVVSVRYAVIHWHLAYEEWVWWASGGWSNAWIELIMAVVVGLVLLWTRTAEALKDGWWIEESGDE